MKLFNKETDLIKRIMNLILVVWVIVAIIITYSSVVDLVIAEEKYSFEEYKVLFCNDDVDTEYKVDTCEKRYQSHNNSLKRQNHYKNKTIVTASGNIIIVGAFIYFLNNERK